jgi:hypothetical protein
MRGISIAGFVTLSITLVLAGTAALLAADAWHVGKAADYPNQTASKITVGAKPFSSETDTEPVFGKKADFNKYGILPVLVVIENRRSKTLDLRDLEVTLVGRKGQHVDPVRPDEVAYVALPAQRPSMNPKLPFPTPKKKNPLNVPELTGRAFVSKLIPPGDSASGFFYFEAQAEPGMKLYLNRLKEQPSGEEILYFEFPITEQ